MMKTLTYIFLLTGFFLTTGEIFGSPITRQQRKRTHSTCITAGTKFSKSDLVSYRVGLVFGQNISTINRKDESVFDVIPGLMGGVAAQIIWPKGYVIQPEILYSQKGCMFVGENLRYIIDYIEVPVKLKYRINLSDIKPFVFTVPYVAYAINMSTDGDGVKGKHDLSEDVNKFDFGYGFGAGFDVWRVQISFNYTYGLAQVTRDVIINRYKTFSISAGIFF